jgi:hypothetical protein
LKGCLLIIVLLRVKNVHMKGVPMLRRAELESTESGIELFQKRFFDSRPPEEGVSKAQYAGLAGKFRL